MKEQQGISRQFFLAFGDNQTTIGTADHPMKIALAQPIKRKTLLFQRDQFVDIVRRCNAKVKKHGGTVMFE